MAITIEELRAWLLECERNMQENSDHHLIHIDDGGLTLEIEHDGAELYLEVGGEREP